MKLGILLFLSSLFITLSCKKEPKYSYVTDIQPLLTSCSSPYCHGSGDEFGSTKDYQSVVDFMMEGRVLGALRFEDGYISMPQGVEEANKWTSEEIAILESWIEDGMPER